MFHNGKIVTPLSLLPPKNSIPGNVSNKKTSSTQNNNQIEENEDPTEDEIDEERDGNPAPLLNEKKNSQKKYVSVLDGCCVHGAFFSFNCFSYIYEH